ncbi:MAG: FtsX-like permease family protein [Ilumatobacteraceae bacterium]
MSTSLVNPAALLSARCEIRGRASSYVMLVVVVALGVGVSLGSAVLAHRTSRAYPDFVHSSHVNPLVVNPSLQSEAIDAAIRSFDGVRSVHSSDLLFASAQATRPFRVSEIAEDDEEAMMQVLGSPDGRFLDIDRPAVTQGRLPTGESELFVSEDFRDQFSHIVGRPIVVGDVVDMGFFPAGSLDMDPAPDDIITPLGVEHLRVVGYGHLADEVLPDGVYPRQRLIVSADVARRYRCSIAFRADMTLEEARQEYFGAPCATSYRYYSLDLKDGVSLSDVREQFQAASEQLTPELPAAIRQEFEYFYISQDRVDIDHAVRQAIRPLITALVAFAMVASIATLVLFALVLTRLEREHSDQRILLALGASRGTRAAAAGSVPLISVLVGLGLAVVMAGGLSLIGPLGSVRSVQPDVGWSLPASIVVPGVILSVVFFGGTVMLATVAGVRRAERRPGSDSAHRRLRLGAMVGPLALVLGVRAAMGDRRSGAGAAVLLGCVVTLAVVVASAIFGSNLSHVLNRPAEFGWPWQVGVVTGSGYGDTDVDAVAHTLDERDDVQDYRLYSFDPSTRVNGVPVPVVFGDSGRDGTAFIVVSGRPAQQPGEIVLGTRTADELGVGLGDAVQLSSPRFDELSAIVVGTALLPSIGAFVADRSGLGRGAFVPVERTPGDTPSFVAIRLRAGVDIERFLGDIGPDVRRWDLTGQAPIVLRTVRPPEIVNIREMRGAPLLLSAILALSLAIGMAVAISVSVRERRRDLAVLRALGLGDRALKATVHWQALTTIAVGLLVGIPVGIAGGNFAWRQFAEEVGLVPNAHVPNGWLLVVAAGGVVVALGAAYLPARSAARLSPATSLRTQ